MKEYARPLSDAVRSARIRLQLTQNHLAEAIDVDARTILNIENYKGNPKLEVLYPLVRYLKLDAREIFTPEILTDTTEHRQLRQLIEGCTKEEVAMLIPIVSAVVSTWRNHNAIIIK